MRVAGTSLVGEIGKRDGQIQEELDLEDGEKGSRDETSLSELGVWENEHVFAEVRSNKR